VNRFVIDASVVLNWCFPDENAPLAQTVALMFKQGDSAMAPAFWPHEVLNALLVGEKRKRISRSLLETFLADLGTLPVELQHFPSEIVFGRVQEISRGHGLTAYDAAYLHLAEMSGLALATLDDDLATACRKSGVALV
jgi:predicted nucleic acid-binding protein